MSNIEIKSKIISQEMLNSLDTFFAQKTIADVDRNTFQVLNLRDTSLKITISLVFMRNWTSINSDDYNVVSIRNYGAVFTFPCYWISIPKELCLPYFIAILEDFYENEVSKWGGTSSSDSGNTSGSGSGSNMPCSGNCNCR